MINRTLRCTLLTTLLLAAACAQLPTVEQAVQDDPVQRTQSLATPEPAAPVVAVPAPEPEITPPAPVAAVITPPRDLWERIRAGFTLPALDNERVRDWETYYAAQPEYLARMVERSSHYLFHITAEIERRKLPAEIALLPMIESAYNPQAYSKAHASGLWQFIPSTGKLYGLRQNWWYDGRRDVIAATGAALDYLEKLYAQFGDWELALASYNWGEGAVARAVARNQAKGMAADYSSLSMPAETRNYLPKLIAVKNIIADPERFGVQLASIPNEPYFEVITLKRHIDIKLAAKFAGMPLDEFKFLNPAHNKAVIKAGSAENIVLPRDRVAAFRTNLENNDKPLVSWQAHTIKRGEAPEKIAAKYGISVAELKRVNGIVSSKKFRPGLPLLVPVKAGAAPYLPDLPATKVSLPRAYKAARRKNAKRSTRAVTRHAVKSAPAKHAKKPVKAMASNSKPDAAAVVATQDRR